jgi:putative hydrolase of the HAD superfamily
VTSDLGATPAPSAISVVLFDLDDTLFAHRKAVDDGIVDYVRMLGSPYQLADAAGEVAAWHELEERHYHSYLGGRLDYEGQRRARAIDFAARHGVALDEAAASTWFASYFEHYVENWVLHDDALPCLDELRSAGLRLGLITNGDEAFQLRKLAQLNLTDRFEHIVTSGALGIPKPDARIFEHACALFGVPPAAAAYVGDRLATDAIGAARAGLTGVWLDRIGASVPEELAALARESLVIRVASLAGLPAALPSR